MAERRTRPETEPDGQCGTFETGEGETVVYDLENANAWLQSSYAIDFEDVRATGPRR